MGLARRPAREAPAQPREEARRQAVQRVRAPPARHVAASGRRGRDQARGGAGGGLESGGAAGGGGLGEQALRALRRAAAPRPRDRRPGKGAERPSCGRRKRGWWKRRRRRRGAPAPERRCDPGATAQPRVADQRGEGRPRGSRRCTGLCRSRQAEDGPRGAREAAGAPPVRRERKGGRAPRAGQARGEHAGAGLRELQGAQGGPRGQAEAACGAPEPW
mmetsp:Transcript_19255/g.58229  ORF Transcript_19255/g.58229 Transcript_19255/m.58229 type:complete len:218 (-) Transcript_19255:180-833(-)